MPKLKNIKGEFERVRVYSVNGWKRAAIVRERHNYVLMKEVATFRTLADTRAAMKEQNMQWLPKIEQKGAGSW